MREAIAQHSFVQIFKFTQETSIMAETFNEEIYLASFPAVAELVKKGDYTSGLDYYTQVGQFDAQQQGFFNGTNGDDIVSGFGKLHAVTGVGFEANPDVPGGLSPLSVGETETDVLVGAPGKSVFMLGNLTNADGSGGEQFYVGNGISDFARIKNFDAAEDVIYLAGEAKNYVFSNDDTNFKISTKEGDLVAIVENVTELEVNKFYDSLNVTELGGDRPDTGFSETVYAPFYPDVMEGIEQGLFSSGLDHYRQVGQFQPEPERDSNFAGTAGNDIIIGWSENVYDLIGFGFEAGASGGFRTTSHGVGEIDTLVGSDKVFNEFKLLGADARDGKFEVEKAYVGQGDNDYALVQNFDTSLDEIILAGSADEYALAVKDGNTQISTKEGDLVAIVEGVTELKDFTLPEDAPFGIFSYFGIDNPIVQEPATSQFNEDFYLAVNPDVKQLVDSGDYTSALDYYTQVGQTTEEKEGFFTGTPGNDTVQGFGDDKDLFGVGYKDIFRSEDGTVTLTPTSLGVGEVDTLLGTEGFDGNYLAAYNSFNFETFTGDTVPLYVGNGDQDYALIKNLDPTDGYIAISTADFSEYDFKVDEEGFKIYYENDLIGVAEGIYDLQVGFYEPTLELAALSKTAPGEAATGGFDEDLYLQFTPDAAAAVESGQFSSALEYYVAVGQSALNEEGEPASEGFFTGTSGNDYMIGFGQATGLSGVGLKARTDLDPSAIEFESTGMGEVDTLIGNDGKNGFLLGSFVTPASPEQFVFYQGKGDEDYALIQNFKAEDALEMAGKFEDYMLEEVDGDVKVSYKGDLVAIVKNASDLQVIETFVDGEANSFTLGNKPVEPVASEPLYGTTGDDILELLATQQLVFAGAGNDLIDATAAGSENRIYGGTGKDTFILGSRDVLTGQAGDDRFFAQTGGDNLMTGGAGADQFWISSAEIPESANTITDFTLGEDVIGIAGLGASFEGLTLTQQNDNTLIAFNNNDLSVLNGIQSSSLSASNFAFV
jgi:hypothetical protein